jgi:hypothetical protein
VSEGQWAHDETFSSIKDDEMGAADQHHKGFYPLLTLLTLMPEASVFLLIVA